jgi:putative endonuclease
MNTTKPFTSFTSKYRPWTLKVVFKCGTTEKEAMRMEKFIKNQKSILP